MTLPLSTRPSRLFGLALGAALAGGVAVTALAAAGDAVPPMSPRHAMPPAPGPMLPRGPMLDRLLDDVQATPDQRAQVRRILEAQPDDAHRAFAADGADREQLAQLFAAPVVDPAAIEAVRQRIQARRDEASRRSMQAMVAVAQVLTPSQRQALLAVERDRAHRPRHGFGAWREHGFEHPRDAAWHPLAASEPSGE